MQLFEIFGSIGLKDEGFAKGIGEATEKGESFGSKFGKVAAGVGKAAVGIATAATGVATAIGAVAMKSAEAGDRVDKMSQKLGLTREGFQEWDYILAQNGASIDSFGVGMKTLQTKMEESTSSNAENKAAIEELASAYKAGEISSKDYEKQLVKLSEKSDKGSELFDKLGISLEAISKATPEEAMELVVQKLQEMPESAEKTRLALDAFGKQGMELMPMLNQTAEGTEELRQRAHELGMVMSDEAVDAGVVFGDTLDDAKRMVKGFANSMGADILPAMTTGIEAFIGFAQGAEGSEKKLKSAFDGIVKSITTKIPQFVQMGSQMLLGLISGIASALPDLVGGVMQVVPTIITTILSMLPDVLSAGPQVLTGIITGIAQALPNLVPIAVQTLMTLIQGIIDNIPLIIDAGLQLLDGLATGIVDAIPVLMEALPNIIDSITTFFTDNFPVLIQTGVDLLTSLIADMPKIISTILDALPELISSLIDAIIGNIPVIIDAGIQLFISLVEALPQIIQTIVKALPKIITSVVDALIGNIDKIIMAGIQLFVALIENLPTIIVEIVKAIPQIITGLVNAFISFMPKLAETGLNLIKGLWEGIKDAAAWLWEKISGFFGGIVDKIKNFFGISSPSKLFRDQIGKMLPAGMAEGIKDGTPKAIKAAEKMAKDTYNSAKTWIEDYRNDTNYLAAEEIKMWQALSDKYSSISKEKVEIDKNIAKLQEQINKDSFNKSKKWIETRKFFNMLSLEDEAAAWERVQSRYLEGTAEREEADKNLYTVQQELANKRKSLIDQINTAEANYNKAVEDRANTIYRSFGLFDELKQKEAVSTQALSDNLKSQVEALQVWSENLASLAARGINEGFLSELRAMGPSANAEISALSKMTDEQLTSYQDLWAEKHRLAAEQAIGELEPLRAETNKTISGLMDELEGSVKDSAVDTGKNMISGLIDGMKEKAAELLYYGKSLGASLLSGFSGSGEISANVSAIAPITATASYGAEAQKQTISDVVLGGLQEGFAMVSDTILDALPDVLQFSIDSTLAGEALFNGIDRAARRQGRLGFATREEIAAIARSVMPAMA